MANYITDIEEYPHSGKFYEIVIDNSLPLDQRVEEEVTIMETECDIQEAGSTVTGGITNASFSIYFPFDKTQDIKVHRGHLFRGDLYGMLVDGEVIGVFPTQLDGCVAYIKDKTA